MPRFTRENAAAMGARGGKTTLERHGREHLVAIGRQGFQTTVNRHWNGDRTAYLERNHRAGWIACDPHRWNRAWAQGETK